MRLLELFYNRSPNSLSSVNDPPLSLTVMNLHLALMFIFLLILISCFSEFCIFYCPKQCQLYSPNRTGQKISSGMPINPTSPLLLYECKISSWHLFRLLTSCSTAVHTGTKTQSQAGAIPVPALSEVNCSLFLILS